jgi:hypothetical protein
MLPSAIHFPTSAISLQQSSLPKASHIQKAKAKSLVSSFSESFIPSGKQGGGAVFLREGHDIVTGETCIPSSLNVNNIGKAAELHLAF